MEAWKHIFSSKILSQNKHVKHLTHISVVNKIKTCKMHEQHFLLFFGQFISQ